MARDYKNSTPTKRKPAKKTPRKKISSKASSTTTKSSGVPRWVVFLAGIAVTFAILWLKDVFFNKQTPQEPRDLTPYSQLADNATSDVEKLPEEIIKPKEVEQEFELKRDPRFTFYERLPKDEIIIPQEALEVEVDKNISKEPLEKIEKEGSYVIQAGSFQEFTDADRRKAELALLGLESAIQKVSIDKRNWYRVRIGPYIDLVELNATRQRLRDGSIDVLVIRTQ